MEPRTPEGISDYCAPTRRPNAWFVPSMVGRRRTAMSLATTVNTVWTANTECRGTGCQRSPPVKKTEELRRNWGRIRRAGGRPNSPLTKSALDASGLV